MAVYTPRHESITGASLTGSDGATNRTYTLANSNSIQAQMTIILAGQALMVTTDYTKSGDTITFIPNVDNNMVIIIDYFTSDQGSVSTNQQRYGTISEVYRTAGVTSTEISEADAELFLLEAEAYVDRLTNTTYWQQTDNGTATAGASTTLTDTGKDWSSYDYSNDYVWIYGGTGSGQMRRISSHTATVLTVDTAWSTNPSTDSTYRIIHTGTDPYIDTEFDGDGRDTWFLAKYPLRLLESLTIDSTSITTSYVHQDDEIGRLQLGTSAEKSKFVSTKGLKNEVNYWYGVWERSGNIPRLAKRLTLVVAAMSCLEAQMGGTHNIPSTYTLPELGVTVGQAYINIRGTYDVLRMEAQRIEAIIPKYAVVA